MTQGDAVMCRCKWGRVGRWAVVVSLTTFLVTSLARGAEPSSGVEPPAFEVQPTDEGGNLVAVTVDTAQVLRAEAAWWSRAYHWEGVAYRPGPRAADGSLPFTWDVAGLGIAGDGKQFSRAANELTWEWHLTAPKDWPVEGEPGGKQPHGGLTFLLDLTAGARRGCTADPVLKEDKTGFTWEVTPGRAVTVSFEKPLAALYFERNQKNEIRCMLYDAPIVAGKLDQAMTVALPEGGKAVPSDAERFASDTRGWFVNALDPDRSFVDLSYLNEQPAGQHGFVQARGSRLVFSDGTPARLWGMSLSAYTLFPRTKDGQTDKALIDEHAKRLAALGCNLMRITQADSNWVRPNLIAPGPTTDKLDDQSLDAIFCWVKALKERGIYVWLDMITYRPFLEGDRIPGWEDFVNRAPAADKGRPLAEGFSYLNPRIEELWQTTSRELLTRVNPYTGLALKDEPAMAGVMIWNENDLTGHFGNSFLADKNAPYHRALFLDVLKAFAGKNSLNPAEVEQTWLPGASKLLLNDMEYRWNHRAAEFLRSLGVRSAICAGHIWGMSAFSLPALTAGDVIDSHAYSRSQFLDLNPRAAASATDSIAWARLADRPKIISEYNMEDRGPQLDAFTIMPYTATMAAFQDWDAAMLYAYSQDALRNPGYSPWNSYRIPQTMGMAPAAALIYREQHVHPAAQTVYLSLSREQTFYRDTSERTSRAIRTVMERHRLMLGLPAVPELDWFKATVPPAGAETVTDLDRDFIPPGDEVVSDTGEFRRNWAKGVFVIDTPMTQLAMGLLQGNVVRTADASFAVTVPKAAVALSSLDGHPLRQSRRILVSTSARTALDKDRQFLSEPVAGTVTLNSTVQGLKLVPLKGDGTRMDAVPIQANGEAYTIPLATDKGTHWFMLDAD